MIAITTNSSTNVNPPVRGTVHLHCAEDREAVALTQGVAFPRDLAMIANLIINSRALQGTPLQSLTWAMLNYTLVRLFR
jgi:hypothetical protein